MNPGAFNIVAWAMLQDHACFAFAFQRPSRRNAPGAGAVINRYFPKSCGGYSVEQYEEGPPHDSIQFRTPTQ